MKSVIELLYFFVKRRKWLLLPLVFMSLALGGLLALGSNPTVLPFIYALF